MLCLQVLARCRGVEDVTVEFADIVEAARQSNLIKQPYKNICQKKYRPQLFVAIVFMIFQQFDGELFKVIIVMMPHDVWLSLLAPREVADDAGCTTLMLMRSCTMWQLPVSGSMACLANLIVPFQHCSMRDAELLCACCRNQRHHLREYFALTNPNCAILRQGSGTD